MPYQINFSDSSNKGFIVVEEDTINKETSLSLPGRQVRGYGEFVAQNFLHLLENFANTSPPPRPVEGQLWYDTSENVSQLKVYDGLNWVGAGGLKKSRSSPLVASSVLGDLWVNTSTQQLYLFTGSSWVLVGPEFSQGRVSGIRAETVIDIDDKERAVLEVRVDNKLLYIISSEDDFTPKTLITGFPRIYKGITQVQQPPNGSGGTSSAKYYGVSEKAEALVVNNQKVGSENFLRSDRTSTTNFPFNVRNNTGLSIGNNSQAKFFIDGDDNLVIQNSIGGKRTVFVSSDNSEIIDLSKDEGVNVYKDLDLDGNKLLAGNIEVSGPLTVDGSVEFKDSLSVLGEVNFSSNVNVKGNVIPENDTVNLGSNGSAFNEIHSKTIITDKLTCKEEFVGDVAGNATTSNGFVSPVTINISGAFSGSSSFKSGGDTAAIDISLSSDFIVRNTNTRVSQGTDFILISTGPDNQSQELRHISKNDFLRSVPLPPVGSITQYAGDTPPPGWLFCDGQSLNKATYNLLYTVVGDKFGSVGTEFKLPDLRSRVPLGFDNRPNQQPIGGTGGQASTTLSINNLPNHTHGFRGDSGGQYYAASFVASSPDGNSETLSYKSGTDKTHGIKETSGVTNLSSDAPTPIDNLPPYIILNYIIYTGKE